MTQQEFIEKTKCQVSCSRTEYSFQREVDDYQKIAHPTKGRYGDLGLMIKDGTVTVSHEVKMYDEYDLISDFGGMLGLLLGASVLSMYELIVEIIKNIIEKRLK